MAKDRVRISYADPHNEQKQVELPFVMGIMSDLSGNASPKAKEPLTKREFAPVTAATLDQTMSDIQPGVAMMVKNHLDPAAGARLGINMTFSSMDDLTPAGIARGVPALARLLAMRQELAALKWHLNGKPGAADRVREILSDPALMAALAERRAAEERKAEEDARALGDDAAG
jgi:type VI secretion system protein ImpB